MAPLIIVGYGIEGREPDPVEGKFLLLRWRAQLYLLAASRQAHRYHNQILAHFADERGIPCQWVSREELETYDQDLQVRGGGRFSADAGERTLTLWDDSHAYGRFAQQGLAEAIAGSEHPWSAYRVRIR